MDCFEPKEAFNPPCYQPKCETCSYRDSCKNYQPNKWNPYPGTGDPYPPTYIGDPMPGQPGYTVIT